MGGFSGQIDGLREKYAKVKLSTLTKSLGKLDYLNTVETFLGKAKSRLTCARSILEGRKVVMSLEYGLAITRVRNDPFLMEDLSEEEIKKRCKRYGLAFDPRFIREEIVDKSSNGEIPFKAYKAAADKAPRNYVRVTPMEEREANEYTNLSSNVLLDVIELLKSSLQEHGRQKSSRFFISRWFNRFTEKKGGALCLLSKNEKGQERESSVSSYLQEVVDLQKQISALNNRTEELTLDDRLYGELVREKVNCHEGLKSVWRKFQGILDKGYWSFTDYEPVDMPILYEQRREGKRIKISKERENFLILGKHLEYAVFNNNPEFRKKHIR